MSAVNIQKYLQIRSTRHHLLNNEKKLLAAQGYLLYLIGGNCHQCDHVCQLSGPSHSVIAEAVTMRQLKCFSVKLLSILIDAVMAVLPLS